MLELDTSSPCHTGLSGTYSKQTLSPLPLFLRPTTTRKKNSFGWDLPRPSPLAGAAFVSFGPPALFLLCNAVTVLPQPFSVDQILHGLVEETVRLLMGLFGCTIKNLNAVFQQLTGTDLPKKDNYPLARHLQEL